MKTSSFKGWCIFLALVLVAAFAAAPAHYALADAGGAEGHAFDVTFTKWVTGFPNMTGVVGGDTGTGTFAAEALSLNVDGTMEYVHAVYYLDGSRHSLTADIHATQDDATHTGVITGTVTDGWLKGATLQGEYKVFSSLWSDSCPIETPGNTMGDICFQGVLHLYRAP